MRLLILLALVATVALSAKWAVLVAGSNTYANYRHQADVFHAYQLLLKNGFDASKIITMAYDDIATDIRNPFKGKVFNKPTGANPGDDVYAGVKIDYSKAAVTPEIFLNVLEGNKTAVKGKGTERVLESTGDDNVFIFFSDHGAPGLIAFPSKYLYANDLLATFARMKGKYSKLVFYLESCESGSMFQKLPNNTKIYALSAANPTESSWATYCPPSDIIQGKHVGSCLGDLFSVSFIEETEKGNYWTENLDAQFLNLKKLTNESQVMQWGDHSFTTDMVGEYIAGDKKASNANAIKFTKRFITGLRASPLVRIPKVFDSRTVKVQTLAAVYARERTSEALAEMTAEMSSMQQFDEIFLGLKNRLELTGSYNVKDIQFDCLKQVMEAFERKCMKLSDYGLVHVKYFAEACQDYSAEQIVQATQC